MLRLSCKDNFKICSLFICSAGLSKDPLMGAAVELLHSRLTTIKILNIFYCVFVNSTRNRAIVGSIRVSCQWINRDPSLATPLALKWSLLILQGKWIFFLLKMLIPPLSASSSLKHHLSFIQKDAFLFPTNDDERIYVRLYVQQLERFVSLVAVGAPLQFPINRNTVVS